MTPHNPENYSQAKIEVDKGWRTLTVEEAFGDNVIPEDVQYFSDNFQAWRSAVISGGHMDRLWRNFTLRTRAPLPGPNVDPWAGPSEDPLTILTKMFS